MLVHNNHNFRIGKTIMKKTFKLTHPKIKVPRLVEAIKHEVRKYVKRERRRDLPKGVDFLDFDCRFGSTAEESTTVHLTAINGHIDQAEKEGLESFYVEIISKPGHRTKKPVAAVPEETAAPEENEDSDEIA
jgi:hypothetical protein